MQPVDIEAGLKLSSSEGWNQTQKDWELLVETPGNSSIIVERSGKIVGTTTAINYSNQVAWIGMVLVDKECRGRGLSKLLLNDILEKLKVFQSVKLDATAAGQQVYEKFDFKAEYLIARMVNPSMKSIQSPESEILPDHVTGKDIRELIEFDAQNFGANRANLVEFLVSEFPRKAWVLKRNNVIVGFALGRQGLKYHHIGPVEATNNPNAKLLITQCLKDLTNLPVVVDVICDKEELMMWLTEIGFATQRNFVRMYRNQNPFPGEVSKQFLICGPEFG